MKAIAFDRAPGHPFAEPSAIDLIADSALLMPGRPLFVPDFTDAWSARLYVAYRIVRLGKSIERQFAPRYYDAVTLALRLMPEGEESAAHSGFNGLFDNCLTLGKWQPLHDAAEPVSIAMDGLTVTVSRHEADPDSAVALISRVATIKTGDIIMPCHLPVATAIRPDTHLTATVGSTPWLDIRLK